MFAKEAVRRQKGRGRGQQRREKQSEEVERRFGNQLSVQGQVTESGKTTVLSRETHARGRRNEVQMVGCKGGVLVSKNEKS